MSETITGLTHVPGTVAVVDVSVSNTSTTATDLQSYVMPAGFMLDNCDQIEIIAAGTYAANGNNKTVRLLFGSMVLYTTGVVAANSGSWMIRAIVSRTAAATQRGIAAWNSSNATAGIGGALYSTGTEDLTAAVTIKVEGTSGTASTDITNTLFTVRAFPSQVVGESNKTPKK